MGNQEQRAPRVKVKLELEFSHQSTGTIFLKTSDISDTGIFIYLNPEKQPPLGAFAQVKLNTNFEDGEEPPELEVKVVRQTEDGVGLLFIL